MCVGMEGRVHMGSRSVGMSVSDYGYDLCLRNEVFPPNKMLTYDLIFVIHNLKFVARPSLRTR